MPRVVVRDASADLKTDIAAVLDQFGGVSSLVQDRPILVKPNGVHFNPGQATATGFLEALFGLLRDASLRRLFLMESCTAGNLTRVVFRVLGWDRLCRKYGVQPVFLDEGRTRPLRLPGETQPVQIPAFLYERLIERRPEHFYLNVPRLKTHSMSHVTLGIKNQQGLLIPRDRMTDHNFQLGRRLVRILGRFRPDFTLVEGITATIYGHFPLARDLKKSIVDTRVIIGGDDVVAVDTVGARILGYQTDEIDHLRGAGEAGLGCADLDQIQVIGDLSRFRERYPYLPELQIPESIRCIHGRERACIQGCRGNTEMTIDLMVGDYGGRGGWNFICGKGIAREELAGLEGDFLIVGPCAAAEAGDHIKRTYPGRRVFIVPEHNDLAAMSGKVAWLTRPKFWKMLPLAPWTTLGLLLKARKNGLLARLISPL
jgi:uncharacterized protein (DUF362 family)